jgi:hypothetical protein
VKSSSRRPNLTRAKGKNKKGRIKASSAGWFNHSVGICVKVMFRVLSGDIQLLMIEKENGASSGADKSVEFRIKQHERLSKGLRERTKVHIYS